MSDRPLNEEAIEVFRRIANGQDEIVSCEPPWRTAWCENVEVKTKLGYTITIFHRWGCWKYTDEVRGPDGVKLYDYGDGGTWSGPEERLSEDEGSRLDAILPMRDPEHYFNKREQLREDNPEEWHKQEAGRCQSLADALQPGDFKTILQAMADGHRKGTS